MRNTFTCFFTCLLLGICSTLFAQKKVLQSYFVPLTGTYPDAGIRMAATDRAGFIWYYTYNGLYRYDGRETIYFGLKTTPALPWLSLNWIQPDGKGNLWLGFEFGLAKFDLQDWKITPIFADNWAQLAPKEKSISTIFCTPDGEIYVSTGGGFLYIIQNDSLHLVADITEGIKHVSEPIPGQLWVTTGVGSLVRILVKNGKYSAPIHYNFYETRMAGIYRICYTKSGTFLFSARDKGLFRGNLHNLNDHSNLASPVSRRKYIKGLIAPIKSPVQNLNEYNSPFYLDSEYVAVMTGKKMESKNIYAFNFKTDDWRRMNPFPLNFPGFISGISPHKGNTFVYSKGGITYLKLENIPFTSLLSIEDGMNSIRSIFKKGNTLFIGSYNEGFLRYNELTNEIKHIANAPIYDIIPWSKDSLLLANEGGGLYWYIPSSDRLTAVSVKNSFLLLPKMATVLCRVNDTLVLEGRYHGVKLINPEKRLKYFVFKGKLSKILGELKIDAIMPVAKRDSQKLGKYFLATTGGVFIVDLDRGRVKYLFQNEVPLKIKTAIVFSLLQVGNQIWMGSGGLGVLASDSSGRQIPMEWLNSQLKGNLIYSLTQLGNSVLIGSNNGLYVLHLKDSTIEFYNTSNGLPSNKFNQAAVFNDGKEVYLGTVNGIVHWKKNNLKKPMYQDMAPIHIGKLTVLDKDNVKSISYNIAYLSEDSQRIIIPPNAKYFSISFGKPNEKGQILNYYYRLNLNQKWISLGRKQEITFIKTPPGDYKLQFATESTGENLIPLEKTIPLIVEPTFWQTIWFKIVLVLAIAGLFYLIFRIREIQKNKERNFRMKIAGDLHDEVGSMLTRIWHQAQTNIFYRYSSKENKSTVSDKNKDKHFHAIAQTSQEALSMMSDMVWSIDARFDTREELILRMNDYAYKLKNESDIPLKLQIKDDAENRKISQVVRQNFFLLFKEGINNAVKHGDGKLIQVKIHFNDKIKMKIANTYCKNKDRYHNPVQGGRGLPIMQKRARNMCGDLQVVQEDNSFVLILEV